MNERMKILKMLEEGKITADEAAKLLEAVGKEKKKDIGSKVVNGIMDGVSSIVGAIPGTIGSVFCCTMGEEKEIKVEKGDAFILKSVGSSIKLSHNDKDEFILKPSSGLIKSKKENSTITSKIVGGSVKILYPSSLSVSIKDAGGTIEGVGSAVLSLKQVGGSTQLTFDEIEDVNIDSKGGSVTLYVGDCDVAFDISAPNGEVEFDVPAKFTVEKEDEVKGTIKKGKGKLFIYASYGNVSVLPLKEKEEK
ncbi:hypothetical protein KAX75_03060 [candidate division WOR-3 bacterium]|nr:hypothetical protein [candidate division WOR-3 bacterium]